MEINNIDLPAYLLEGLFKSSLIESVNDKTAFLPENISGDIHWKYLGNNQKNILIIVDYKNTVHLPDEQLIFLTKMLSACALSLNDVAIVNINHHPGLFHKEFNAFFNYTKVFLFNIEPASFGLPVSFPHYQVQPFSGKTFLFTPSLNDIEKDKVQKSKLWVCLRRIFGI